MVLKNLLLKNFRNYQKREFEFSSDINLIIGPNAIGKTNILEAVYLMASGKCFRVKGVEREAIKYNEEIGRVRGEIGESRERREGSTIEIVLTVGEVGGEKTAKKRYFVNGVGKRQLDFLGNLRAVYFGPEDLDLIIGSPGLRRKYLDMVLYQVDREYARAHLSYEKGLRSRNKILESFRETRGTGGQEGLGGQGGQGIIDRRRLYFWDQLLIKNGNIITRKREEYIEFLNTEGQEGLEGLEGQGRFKIEYDRSTISEERLAKYAMEEVAAGVTLVGPHRDDFKFRAGEQESRRVEGQESGRDLSIFGSRGEQRLAVLWLKLGELEFIKKQSGDLPVLLLDDIFSELDIPHRKLVFELIKKHQTIITTADRGMVEEEWLKGVNIIELSKSS